VATGPATDFVSAGIQVPLIPNARTTYSAQSTDALGNVSPCSSSVPGGTVAFTNAQFCADGAITSAQLFSPLLQGCGGKVTFPNRATLCAPGCRPATADEWVANSGSLAPTHHYWTDDVLNYSNANGACGQGGCDTNACFVTRTNAQSSPCPAGQPMRVCAGSGGGNLADSDGNTCTWTACGYNSVAPKQSFGGCSGTSDNTAGTLCACGIKHWFVSTAGNDSNPGTSAQPFKTVTKALSLAKAGETVFVKPGQYGTANGDTLPFNVPAGVLLIGDESTRGTASGQITLLFGTVVPAAGAVVAGFEITGVTPSNGLSASAAGATIRSNSFVGSQNFAMQVTAPNQTILLNAFSGNPTGWGILFSAPSTPSGKLENNAFTTNSFGIEMDAPGGDLGGGSAGSVGNNVFSCNSQADLWIAAGVAVTASNNKWDHVPPTTSASDTRAGMDFFTQAGANVTGNSNSIRAGASLAPGTICP
jgi:hypothetical protein